MGAAREASWFGGVPESRAEKRRGERMIEGESAIAADGVHASGSRPAVVCEGQHLLIVNAVLLKLRALLALRLLVMRWPRPQGNFDT